jgi:hypothetical protein
VAANHNGDREEEKEEGQKGRVALAFVPTHHGCQGLHSPFDGALEWRGVDWPMIKLPG